MTVALIKVCALVNKRLFKEDQLTLGSAVWCAVVASTAWGTNRYMSMKHLDVADSAESDSVAG